MLSTATKRARMNLLKAKRLHLRDESKRYGPHLIEVPRIEWSNEALQRGQQALRMWRSKDFCVQLWKQGEFERLTVCRTEINSAGGWKDGITWDDLERLKNEAGYSDRWAVECYPPADRIVNVANMRHLFLLPEPPAFGWHDQS